MTVRIVTHLLLLYGEKHGFGFLHNGRESGPHKYLAIIRSGSGVYIRHITTGGISHHSTVRFVQHNTGNNGQRFL